MNILFYCLILILAAFIIHLVIWRVSLPQNQRKALLVIFFLTFIMSSLILYNFSDYFKFFGLSFSRTIFEYLQFSLLFTSLTLAYITTYSAIEVDSPSLVIVSKVKEARKTGLDKEVLCKEMNDDMLVGIRVKDLLRDNMIFLERGRYKLTKKGNLLVSIFVFYRRLLNAGKGG